MVGSKKKVDDEKMSPDPKIRKITKLEKSRKNAKKIIAIDMGGTYIRIAVLKKRKVLEYWKEKTPKTSFGIKSRLLELIDGFMSDEIKGIAVASPGPLKGGTIKNPPNLPLRNYNYSENEGTPDFC